MVSVRVPIHLYLVLLYFFLLFHVVIIRYNVYFILFYFNLGLGLSAIIFQFFKICKAIARERFLKRMHAWSQ